MLQTQASLAQSQFWFDEHGRTSFWQELSDERNSWPPKQLVPAPDVGQAQVDCVLLYAHVCAPTDGAKASMPAASAATATSRGTIRWRVDIRIMKTSCE